MRIQKVFIGGALLFAGVTAVLGNGGAWQVGVPLTGNAAASDKGRSTDIALEDELLTIDLHQEFAAIEVRYKMRNTGGQVTQDFFFPVERWAASESEEGAEGGKPADLEDYRITADKTELKSKNIPSPEKPAVVVDEHWGEFPPATKLWKKSEIPFAPKQEREIVIRYRVAYSGSDGSVSDDGHNSEHVLVYSLSPAATWKGKIVTGKIVVNLLLPRPEEVEIANPKDRFQKITDTRTEWTFKDLEPTLADDLKIVVHPRQDSYPVHSGPEAAEGDEQPLREYVFEGPHYFFMHSDFDAVASSTLPAAGGKTYDIKNVKGFPADNAWAEGKPDDGIGESITLDVKRPLPLDEILIMPGYRSTQSPALWKKNNRVAELEVTLNGNHTFTAKIPDEEFTELYPIPVRDYAEPVKTVKLVIKGVHRGTAGHDTCISSLRLRGILTEKPQFQPAR
ncbi:MAG: hypothetical protein ABI992_08100 [Chthoniobacterales bacterium]